MRGIKVDRSRNRSTGRRLSTRIECPWETIKMVPTTSVAGHMTSLDSQPNREHAVFSKPELLPDEVRTPFVLRGEKPVAPPPVAAASAAPKPASPPPPAA